MTVREILNPTKAKLSDDFYFGFLFWTEFYAVFRFLIGSKAPLPKPSALAGNTLLDLHNSSYQTQPLSIIAYHTALSSRQLKQNLWISDLFIVIIG